MKEISIHALLAESDHAPSQHPCPRSISIHALLAESDLASKENATQQRNFYPRSPCGERRFSSGAKADSVSISIHALLAESDLWVLRKVPILGIFLSTLSLRRATSLLCRLN